VLSSATQELELLSGQLTCVVSTRAPKRRFAIRAGGHVILVRGTLFSVTRAEDETRIDLAEGAIEVVDAAETARGIRLVAPTRARIADGTLVAQVEVPAEPVVSMPPLLARFGELLSTLDATGELHVSSRPEGAAVTVNGAAVGRTPVVLRVDRGEHLVGLDMKGMAVHEETVVVSDRPASIVHTMSHRVKSSRRADQVLDSLHHHRTEIARCYERALKRRPDLEGTAELRIRVSADGSIAKARVVSGGLPPAVERCVARVARSWSLGRGDRAKVSVPVRFRGR
jgi:hypothetical protein